MSKRNILPLAGVCLLVFLISQMTAVSTAPQEPKPSFPENSTSVQAKIESALDKEEPGTVIVADKEGKIVQKWDVKELRRDGFRSLEDFAHKKAESDDCQRVSTRCVRCPDGKIYCSNEAKFAAAQKSKML